MTLQLTGGQQEAFNLIGSNSHNFTTIMGYAGTGKTTSVVQYLKQNAKERVLFTAPTHKAVSVLRQMCEENQLFAKCETIHHALGLTLRWVEDQQVLMPTKKGPIFDQFDIVFIDESSMLDDSMIAYVVQAQEDALNTRVIFMGDPAQLPPVENCETDESMAFDFEPSIELTEIMRQTGDSNIPALGEYIRSMLEKRQAIGVEYLRSFVDNETVFMSNRAEYWETMLDDFEHAETSGEDVRYLCYTNKAVGKGIQAIRGRLYSRNAPEFMPGEHVLAVKPVLNPIDEQVDYSTDALVTLLDVQEATYHELPAWKVLIGGTWYVAIKAEFHNEYKRLENKFREKGKADRTKWVDFYRFINGVCWIRPAQSMTIHKSQGSTFDRVYVNVRDILSCRDRKVAKKLMYVACSRPRGQLIFLV